MQLFIVSHLERKEHQIFLKDVPELLSQIRKVLRGNLGDTIAVQNKEGSIIRYTIQISDWTDKDLTGEILKEELLLDSAASAGQVLYQKELTMLIAMPNKWDKAELIVQKLTEIGVDEIAFRAAERSVIKQWNEKKVERLNRIAQEATEQSRGWKIPVVSWCKDVKNICEKKGVVVFDIIPLMKGDIGSSNSTRTSPTPPVRQAETNSKGGLQTIIGIIGPEGGLTEKDYQLFGRYEIVGLGKSVLRMETAAIVGGWMLKNC